MIGCADDKLVCEQCLQKQCHENDHDKLQPLLLQPNQKMQWSQNTLHQQVHRCRACGTENDTLMFELEGEAMCNYTISDSHQESLMFHDVEE